MIAKRHKETHAKARRRRGEYFDGDFLCALAPLREAIVGGHDKWGYKADECAVGGFWPGVWGFVAVVFAPVCVCGD